MRKNLLEYLFGPVAERENPQRLGERIIRMFEDADKLEGMELAANKKPLASALKKLGVSAEVENFPQWCEIRFDNGQDYHEAFLKIFTPDGLHDLAEAGWVPAKHGDEAQSNEPPAFRIGFFEIDVAGENMDDTEKAPDLEKVVKDGRECDAEELERNDDLNPVENPDKEKGGKTTGIGKTKDGSDPEGSVKGATKKKFESVDDLLAAPIQEGKHKAGCACGFCKNKGRGFGKKKTDDSAKPEKEDNDGMEENISAHDVASRLLEVTTTTGIAPVGDPMLGIHTETPRPKPGKRNDRLKKRRPDLDRKGFFGEDP